MRADDRRATRAAWLLLAALGLGAPARAATGEPTDPQQKIEIAYRPAPGSKASKKFSCYHALAMQSYSQEENGVEQVSQEQLEISSTEVLRIVDEVTATDAGRPSVLRRMYEGYEYHAELGQLATDGERGRTDVIEWTSPLVGTSVRFTWVPEEEAYGRFYDARDGIEEALVRLSEDTDLRALLPARPVAVGESWSIEPARIASLVAPAGGLPINPTKGGENSFLRALTSGMGGGLDTVFTGETQGTIEARLAEVREEAGARLAVISVEVDVVTSGDQSGLLQQGLTGSELVRGLFVESGRVNWVFKGKGQLAWDLDRGRFESFDLTGSEDVTTDLTLASARGGGKSRQTMRMAGGLKLRAETTRAKPVEASK